MPEQNNKHEQRSSGARGQEHDERNGRVENEPMEEDQRLAVEETWQYNKRTPEKSAPLTEQNEI